MDEIVDPFLISKRKRVDLQRFLYRELIRLTIMVDGNISEPQLFGMMSALVKKAKYQVNGENDAERLNQLLAFLYQDQGFHCSYQEYFYTDNLLLNKVLRQKRGMPVSLGAILLYLGSVLELPLFPVNFPTQLLVRADLIDENGRKQIRYINPWDGSYLHLNQMEKLLEGELGFTAELEREFIGIAPEYRLLERLETVFKMALTREKKFSEALDLIEYRLTLEPDDPYEIRDRGMILASLDCYQAAYDDLSYFIDQCPDDPSALMLKLEIAGLEKQSKTSVLH